MHLIIVHDPSQLGSLAASGELHDPEVRLATGDLATAAHLESEGIPFLDEWAFLPVGAIRVNEDEAYSLGARWWGEWFPGGPAADPSWVDTARQDVVWPFQICLNAATLYERLLADVNPARVTAFHIDPVPVIRTGPAPIHRASASLAQAVLRWLVEQRGLSLEIRRGRVPLSPEGPDWTPAARPAPPAHETVRCDVGRMVTVDLAPDHPGRLFWQSSKHRRELGHSAAPVALLLNTGMALEEAFALEKALQECPHATPVHVRHLDPGVIASLPWFRGDYNNLPLGSPATSQGTDGILTTLDEAWGRLPEARRGYAGPHPALFANPNLEFQFRPVWSELRHAACLRDAFGRLIRDLRPQVLLCGHEAFTRERTLVRLARAHDIPTFGMVHGGWRPATACRGVVGDVERVLVWGEVDRDMLHRWGRKRDRLVGVGSIVHQVAYRRRSESPADTTGGPEAKRLLGMPEDRALVLLLTGPVHCGLALPTADPAVHRRTWRELIRLAKDTPDVTFAIKSHPRYDHFGFYRTLAGEFPANFRLLREPDLGPCLEAADAAALVNYPTTAGLLALLASVPLLYLRTAVYDLGDRDYPFPDGGVPVVDSVSRFGEELARLLSDHEGRAALLNQTVPFLERILGDPRTVPHEQVVEHLLTDLGGSSLFARVLRFCRFF